MRRSKVPNCLLLDDLVGASKQRWWDNKAQRLGSLQIHHQLELRRLLSWKITRSRPFENLVDHPSSLLKDTWYAGPIRHQAADYHCLAEGIYCGQIVGGSERCYALSMIEVDGTARHHQRIHSLAQHV